MADNNRRIGHVVSVQGPVVDIKFSNTEDVPNIYGVVFTKTVDGREIILEVAEHVPGNIARCIALSSTTNLQRNAVAYSEGTLIEVPSGEELYSRIVNIVGQPIDQKGPIIPKEKFPIRRAGLGTKVKMSGKIDKNVELLETGIKMIDLLFPLVKGSKTGVLGGAGLGKTLIVLELIYQIVK